MRLSIWSHSTLMERSNWILRMQLSILKIFRFRLMVAQSSQKALNLLLTNSNRSSSLNLSTLLLGNFQNQLNTPSTIFCLMMRWLEKLYQAQAFSRTSQWSEIQFLRETTSQCPLMAHFLLRVRTLLSSSQKCQFTTQKESRSRYSYPNRCLKVRSNASISRSLWSFHQRLPQFL